MIVAAVQSLSAQNYEARDKRFWMDFQVAQHVGLNKWNDTDYANAGLPTASITEFRAVFNFDPFRQSWFRFFADLGVGVMPGSDLKKSEFGRLQMPNSGTRYYIREKSREAGSDASSGHLRLTWGMSGEFRAADRLSVMPYLGAGAFAMTGTSYRMVLKEDGSNMQYDATYRWSAGPEEYGTDDMMGFLTGRVNLRYKVGPRSSLLLGLEYTHFFDSVDFYGRYTNSFNSNVQRSFREKGNKMNMLAVSVGISFR